MINFIRRIIRAILLFLKRLFSQASARSVVRIINPTGNVSSAVVIIEYSIANANSDLTDVAVTYSVAGGAFQNAEAALNHPQHQGINGLSSSPSGETHYFVWEWQQDIAINPVNDVVMRIVPSTAVGSGQSAQTTPFVISAPVTPPNQRPTIQISLPTGILLQGENVEIAYVLTDAESDPVHIEVEYSIDNGANFRVATESNHPASEGTANLTSSPSGESHKFIWKAINDLPSIPATDVLVRIQSYDSQRGGSDTTAPFSVGSPASNHPPAVRILSPLANTEQASAVEIRYEVSDDNADPVRIEVSYSTDNGLTFLPATEASGFGSEGLINLLSSPSGKEHSFFWKAKDDLATLPATGVILQIQAFDSDPGGIASVGPIDIADNYPPLIQIFSPQPNAQMSAPVEIQYVLTDREGDVCELEAFYSLDNGVTFLTATSHSSGDGVSGLVSDPSGIVKTFMWDAERDLNALTQQDVMFKIRVKDRHAGGVSTSAVFDVSLPVAPSVTILQPTGGVWGNPVPVSYQLSHPGGQQQLPVSFEYSLDNGATFLPASEALNVNSEGLVNLDADVTPVNHFFAWDALRDIPNIDQIPKDNILLRVRATKNTEIGEDISDPFTADAGFVGVPQYNVPASGAKRPVIEQVFTPQDHEGIHVAARFLLKHEENARCNVRVAFSVNGGAFQNATPAFYSDQLTNLPAPKLNAQYRFIWNAAGDLRRLGLQSGQVRLKFTPYIGPFEGAATETNVFSFTIKDPVPVPAPVIKPPLNALRITKIYGDNQHVVAGQLPPDSLVVEVRDSSNQVVQNARLTFSIDQSSTVAATFEEDPNLRATTDYYGRAGIRVRPQDGAGGVCKVLVAVVGVPGVTESFTIESHVPIITPLQNNPTGPFQYGELYSFYFHLDIGQPVYDQQLYWNNNNPVRFKVTPHNAEVSASQISVPGPFASYQNNSIIRVDVTPSFLGGTSTMTTETFRLKIEVPDLTGVQPLEITNQFVVTPFNATHLNGMNVTNNGFGPALEVVDDLRLHLKVVSGHGPQDPNFPGQLFPQKAFPGGTLSTPFKVELSDSVKSYVHTTDRRNIDCTETLTKGDLKIKWRAIGGVLSDSPAKGTDTELEVLVTRSVYFTPTGNAPYSVTAFFNGTVYDDDSQTIDYFIKRNTTNSAGNPVVVTDPYCIFQPGMPVNLRRTFFIHLPEAIGFEDVTKATTNARGPLVDQLKSGMQVKLLIQGLSPVLSNSVFEKVKVETLLANGLEVKQYTGTSLTFKQDLTLSAQSNNDLQSEKLVIVQNENKTTAGTGHGILPLAQVKASVFNIQVSVKTAGLRRKRLRFGAGSLDGDTEFPYESPVGTSPTGGASNSIMLHNGEFVFDRCDLNFPSRVKDISVCRTYRSYQSSLLDPENEYDVAEPLGPGWFMDAGMYLEVAHKHLRFWDDHGAYFDYPYQYPGKGRFIFITLNNDITDDQSAYEIRDRHRNVYHFNIDGTLRFIKDRFNNKYAYEYNEKAQLVRIKDCMQPNHRSISILYHDDTQANRESYLAGKVKEIEDFEGRKTAYEYYPKAPLGTTQIGAPGYLKKVIFPVCETVKEGSTTSENFNSYELFEYEQNTRSKWRLKSVTSLDSKGNAYIFLTNEYDGEGRITRQEEGQGEFSVQYSQSVAHNTEIEYKNKNDFTTKFIFPPSAYWDHTAPIELTDPEDYVTTLKYNYDGHLIYVKPPKGGYTEYVYDDESPFARNHADLLAEIQTSDTGEKRIYTTTYNGRYHFPLVIVKPEGNLPGVDPALFETVNNYDHQRGIGDAGNVLDTHGPRTMNMVYRPLSATDRQPIWVEENPEQEYTYNDFGQVTSHIDERGIKTEYNYYASDSPTEGSVGTAGGGLLAQVRFDTEENTKRRLHLPGDDARPQTKAINYFYNKLGYIKETTDQDGTKTTYTLSQLGKAIKTEIGDGISGLNTAYENHLGPRGEIIRYKETQQGANGYEIEIDYEYYTDGLLKSKRMQMNGVAVGTETYVYDKGDRLLNLADSRTSAQTEHEYDKRDLEVKTTITSGSLSLETTRKYTEDGNLKEVKAPNGDTTTYSQNGFGEIVKVTNAAGVTTETILNDAGVPVISLKRAPSGEVISAREIVVDEYTRVRRYYDLRFTENASAGIKFTRIPENLNIRNSEYLSALKGIFKDAGYGPDDGRTTTDIVWSISGEMVQRKSDELQQLTARYDGLGRVVELDDRAGMRINTQFLDSSLEAETSYTATSDAAPHDVHEFKNKHKFNLAGQLESLVDEYNRTTAFQYDESMLKNITNAENAALQFKYDALNNLEEAQTDLFVAGQSTDPLLQDSIELYNPGKTIRRSMKFDDMGRMISCKNMAGHEYQYLYRNNLLSEIIYPSARSTGNQSVKEIFGYNDNSGRLETYTNPAGEVTSYSYDNDRLTSVTTGQHSLSIKYNGNGYIEEIEDSSNPSGKITYEFDSMGNMIKSTADVNGQNQSTEYLYDGVGRLAKTVYNANEFLENVYDDATGFLKEVKDQHGTIASYSYFGDRIKVENRNGMTTTYLFNNGELTGREVTGADQGNIKTDYKFDVMERLIEKTETFGSHTTTCRYDYDSAGRTLKEENILSSLPQPLVVRYFYDGDNNIRKIIRDEVNPLTGDIEQVTREQEFDERGFIVAYTDTRQVITPVIQP